jgi:hypothetical protein
VSFASDTGRRVNGIYELCEVLLQDRNQSRRHRDSSGLTFLASLQRAYGRLGIRYLDNRAPERQMRELSIKGQILTL